MNYVQKYGGAAALRLHVTAILPVSTLIHHSLALTHPTLHTELFKKLHRLKYNKHVTSPRRILIPAKIQDPKLAGHCPCAHTHPVEYGELDDVRLFPCPVQFIIIIIITAVIVHKQLPMAVQGRFKRRK